MKESDTVNGRIFLSGRYEDFAITKRSSLIGGIKFSGIDPLGVTEEKMWSVARLMRAVISLLPESTTLYQYYCHYRGAQVSATPRGNDQC